jgi:hypothetical protein
MHVFTKFISFASLAVVVTAGAGAQTTPHGYVRVSARDSLGSPITGAEVTVIHGIRDVIARGTTDEAGLSLLAFDAKDSVDLQVTMRKIGFARTDHFFSAGPRDTAVVQLVAARPEGQAVEGVTVTAKRDAKTQSYYLTADDIANSNIPFSDGWDVLKRMRPDMLTSRGGCPTGIQNVWVKGKRIVLPLRPSRTCRCPFCRTSRRSTSRSWSTKTASTTRWRWWEAPTRCSSC